MSFCGTYKHALDERGRFRIPSKLKAGFKNSDGNCMKMGANGCIYVMPKELIEDKMLKLESIALYDEKAQLALTAFVRNMYAFKEDNQGRVLLPQELKDAAGIEKDVVFVGSASKVEIWSGERYAKTDEHIRDNSAEINAALAILGV